MSRFSAYILEMDIMFISLLSSVVVLALIFLREFFLWLRNNLPKSVQCWFCHSKTKVDYRFANNWYCSNCDQYNGFTKDGDYNRLIDNHYEEKLNFTITSEGRTKDAWKPTNRLCEKCNRNQELKVQQLASFVPLNEKNYDIEIEHYSILSRELSVPLDIQYVKQLVDTFKAHITSLKRARVVNISNYQ
uniref:Ima1_N domain-containing protein n=1 Tax=Rhodnius prolixus TaxID=13249 RepID=T1I2E3_RHOPR